MYNIEFYEKSDGTSELWDFMEDLRQRAQTNKDARIQLKQIRLYIQLLADNGTHLPSNITKHIENDIWELRPGNNRILYFYFDNKKFVLINLGKKLKKLQNQKLKKQLEKLLITKKGMKNKMRTWNDYKEHIKNTSPDGKAEIDEIEALSKIISSIIERRNSLGISQRELAKLCNMPQSSVARIESYKSVPKLDTLLKITQSLGLNLTISPA